MIKCLAVRLTAVSLLAALLLTGCGNSHSTEETFSDDTTAITHTSESVAQVYPEPVKVSFSDKVPVSDIRSGIMRQGISGDQKSFECADEKVFFLSTVSGNPLLYSAAIDADTLRPLCSIPDCTHDSSACQAWFRANGDVCFYNGYLYVSTDYIVYRLNLDGTGREEILDVRDYMGLEYNGIANARLWCGVFTFYLTAVDFVSDVGDGFINIDTGAQQCYVPYYYKLDGSMAAPEPMEDMIVQYNDGEAFIMCGPAGANQRGPIERILYLWNPNDNSTVLLADCSTLLANKYTDMVVKSEDTSFVSMTLKDRMRFYDAYNNGYWGTDAAWHLEQRITTEGNNTVICRFDYSTKKNEFIFDTGVEKQCYLHCFSDYIVLTEISGGNDRVLKTPNIYIYNWNFDLIETLHISEEMSMTVAPQDILCGETENRFYFGLYYVGFPSHYIEKSELGSDNVTLHEISYSTQVNPLANIQEIFALDEAWKNLEKFEADYFVVEE